MRSVWICLKALGKLQHLSTSAGSVGYFLITRTPQSAKLWGRNLEFQSGSKSFQATVKFSFEIRPQIRVLLAGLIVNEFLSKL